MVGSWLAVSRQPSGGAGPPMVPPQCRGTRWRPLPRPSPAGRGGDARGRGYHGPGEDACAIQLCGWIAAKVAMTEAGPVGRGRGVGGGSPYARWSKAAGGAVLGWQDALDGWVVAPSPALPRSKLQGRERAGRGLPVVSPLVRGDVDSRFHGNDGGGGRNDC